MSDGYQTSGLDAVPAKAAEAVARAFSAAA